MAKKLTLLAESYEQPNPPQGWQYGQPLPTTPHEKGDTIQPRNDEEYQRLVDLGVAEDPDERNKREREQAQQRLEALEAERQQLDEQIKAQRSNKS